MKFFRCKYTTFFGPILIFSFIMAYASASQNFETTRLKSTAGAGVGSILMDESTVLNPAPLAFFNLSAFYIQKATATQTFANEDSQTVTAPEKSEQLGVIASDGRGKAAGSISYNKIDIDSEKHKRMAASVAYRTGDNTAIGLAYKMDEAATKDASAIDYLVKKYSTISIGITNVFENGFSLGILADDPQEKGPNGARGTVGMQYVYKNFLTLMTDLGSKYKGNTFSENMFYRIGAQFSLFKDIYLRIGTNYDQGLASKSKGIGLSWIQPKLMLDFALQSITLMQRESLNQKNSIEKESSISLSYRF
ncbi:MAG: hypothetical protein A2X86_04890 [Bdellovibrionales bacterium GWA2_49_15]|nr:MAG: hypothetical protein A2X86_04890 [Bdellovibrionales bacterium GWA2_49_15]